MYRLQHFSKAIAMKKLLFFILSLSAFSCSNNPAVNDSPKGKAGTHSDTSITYKTDFTNDTAIVITTLPDSIPINITGRMRGISHPVTVTIPVVKNAQLSLVLKPSDSTANLRINQIFMPDGKADGPFGRSLTRKIGTTGNCKVIIGEDLMQGEEWKGKFSLAIKMVK